MDKRDRVKDALSRLGVQEEQLVNFPPVTQLIREAKAGLKTALKAMRFYTDDETIRMFLEKYDSIPEGDRKVVPWEAVLISENIDARQFAGAVMFALKSYSVNAVSIIALTSHPKVMKAGVAAAMLPSGERDRTMIHQALGFLPSPKGPTFIGKAVFGASETPVPETLSGTAEEIQEPSVPEFDAASNLNYLFPSPPEMQDKVAALRQKMLPSDTTD